MFFSCFIVTASLLHSARLCSDQLVVVFVVVQRHIANREDAKRPLMDELCNIITHNKVEGCLFFLSRFFIIFHVSTVMNSNS